MSALGVIVFILFCFRLFLVVYEHSVVKISGHRESPSFLVYFYSCVISLSADIHWGICMGW